MKIQFSRNRGSVFIVIMVLTGLIGVTLASYLNMVGSQNTSIMRSMAWNQAVAVSEAGIEEAMAHLNRNRTNRNRDGWTLSGTNVVKERVIGTEKYKTYVEAVAEYPTIVSEGWVKHPQKGEFLPQPRTVRVKTTNDALFAKGMVAKGQIDLAGNNIATDSFDPTQPGVGSAADGSYDPARRRDKGDVATNASVVDSLNAWNAEIYGKASTGPGGNVKLQNGTVGSLAYHASGATGIEAGWSSDDMNVYFPDVEHPYAGTATIPVPINPSFSTVPIMTPSGIVNYDYVLGSGSYVFNPGLNLHNKKMLITGTATILVTGGNITVSGNGGITIATNASLQLYMSGGTTFIGGNGIMNLSGKASNFSYWGLPSNKEVTLQGNGDFIGTVYAPQAAMKLGGGGSSGDDFMGASVTASVKIGGHFKFHYDESVGMYGPRRGYTIVTWNEVAPVM